MTDHPPDDFLDPRRRGLDDYDDGWAGGDEGAAFDDPAGSLWEDPQQAGQSEAAARRAETGPGPVPQPLRRDPGYHRQQARRGEYAEYYEPPRVPAPPPAPQRAAPPFWTILILVILGLFAFMALVLACVAVLSL